MIFDDDTDLIEVCSIVLKSKNYEVRGFHKCNDILKEVKIFSPNVILMDNWIPDDGGVKATQQIKNDVLLEIDTGYIFQCTRCVCRNWLRKPEPIFSCKNHLKLKNWKHVISKAISDPSSDRHAGIRQVTAF